MNVKGIGNDAVSFFLVFLDVFVLEHSISSMTKTPSHLILNFFSEEGQMHLTLFEPRFVSYLYQLESRF